MFRVCVCVHFILCVGEGLGLSNGNRFCHCLGWSGGTGISKFVYYYADFHQRMRKCLEPEVTFYDK